uniref:Uncharacterized protein n=1 Tax=Ascaris lumbricoides TaxID=6252 RepID=A0A0M3IV94_ASCLU
MGVLFSRGGDLNQSTQHEELLIWAAEIVARQRETQQTDQRGDQSNPESGSRVQRTRYFASLTDLLRELLHEGESREYLLSEIKLHCGELAGWMGIEKMTAMREMGLLYGCRRRSGRAEFSRHPTRAAFSSFQRASASNL